MTCSRFVVALLLSAISVSAEVYDVATIYRFAGNVTPIAELKHADNLSLRCDDDTCLWGNYGWRQFDTTLEEEGAELYKRTNKLFFPLLSKNFGISFRRPQMQDGDKKIFVYLLPEDDINALDMRIIVLTWYKHEYATSEVFHCSDSLTNDASLFHSVRLPSGKSRQCYISIKRKVIPYLENYNIYFKKRGDYDIRTNIYIQSTDGTNLEVLLNFDRWKTTFITTDSTDDTEFSVKPTYRVTKLSKMSGTLSSPYLFSQGIPKGHSTCITISYYMEARSNISLDVYLEQGGHLTAIGAVNLIGEPQGISRIHQFIWYAANELSRVRYIIKATRVSEDDIILIRKISGCHNAGFATITTVNKRGLSEVQARNNALGYPLKSSENIILSQDPKLGSMFPECFAGATCDWELTNWIRRNASNAPLYHPGHSTEWEYDHGYTLIGYFTGHLQIYFEPHDDENFYSHSYHIFIFLLDNAADVESSNMYVIKLNSERHNEKYILKCMNSSGSSQWSNIQVLPGLRRRCQYLWQGSSTGIYRPSQGITLALSDSKLKVADIHAVDFANSSDITKVQFMSSREGSLAVVQGWPFTWMLTSGEGTLRSPSFFTDSANICVSVTYYLDDTSELQLRIETLNQELLDGAKLTSRNAWTTERKILRLPKQPEGNEIQIVLVGQNAYKGKVMVQRIAGCDIEELADSLVLSNGGSLDIMENIYDVALRRNPWPAESKQCINGGTFDAENQGCVCPAGFSGSICEIGCGINRFGAKCDGICSETLKGCKEIVFCHAKLGCNCATGLQGPLCSSTCEPGYYGAGCRQKCGNCKSGNSTCNIYTGHCSGCLEGYYPPLCKEYYKHFTEAPEATYTYTDNVTVTANLNYISGKGRPKYYQFQYIESDHRNDESPVWLEQVPLLVPECEEPEECVVTEHIINLKQRTTYKIRAVLIDGDGSSYQGQKIPLLTVTTTTDCVVPKKYNYKLRAEHITESGFHVFWEYIPESNWCSPETFQVAFRDSSRWTTYYHGTEQQVVFTDMWYGWEYNIRVVANTVGGPAPYSDILVVKTKEQAPQEVFDINVTSVGSKTVALEWTPPLFTGGLIKHYVISFNCLKLLACSEEDCSYFSGEVKSSTTSVTIGNLIPFAQYSISVAAFAATLGPAKHVLAATDIAEPQVTPGSSLKPVSGRTNTSITVQWEPPQNCSRINGFLHGYLYELIENPMAESPVSVPSHITSVTFSNLVPLTEYTVKVFVINSGGWNPLYPLVITASTRATTPDMVRNLTVYKQGRRMIGFRWNAPKQLYGDLESFTVSYQMNTPGRKPFKSVVKPTPCPAWPGLYCHTFTHLHPDVEYMITVSARNTEVNEDGEPANVTALTKERTPAEPSYLTIIAVNETSITLEWGLPDMINGLLRSFLLSVEGTDSHNPNECCQNLPLQEITVHKEEPSYQFKVTGLEPASTYSVSIAGKTVSLGPSLSISGHTRPPLPVMDDIIHLGSEPVLKDLPVIIKPVTENKHLVSAYLLIVIPENVKEVPVSEIMDEWLSEAITEDLGSMYYIAAEYTQEDLEENPEVFIGTGSGMHLRKLSTTQDPELQNGTDYSLAVAVVLDYCGVKNVGIGTTLTFRIDI